MACLVLVAGASAACIPLPRYASVVRRSAPVPAARIADRMDPWLLAEGLTDKVAVEVDWVEGCEPKPLTLAGLERVLTNYSPAGRPVEVERSDEIPRSAWDALIGGGVENGIETLIAQHAEPVRNEGVEHRYVLFAPLSGDAMFGYSSTFWIERDGALLAVRGVVVFRETHERYDIAWISLDEIERMTLVHEFGHQLGLVADPRHERNDRDHRGHCTRLDCSMAHPTGRLWWRNIWRGLFDVWFKDYCPDCQAEIRTAQDEWRRRRAADPDWEASVRAARNLEIGEATFWKKVRPHLEADNWEAVLRETEHDLVDASKSRAIAAYRVWALARLERVDDSLAVLAGLTVEDDSEWARVAGTPARALIAAGRHADALTLLARVMDERGVAPNLDDSAYRQTAFVVVDALEGMGRYGDAAELVLQLATRYDSPAMKVGAGDLLRRGGDLDRAEAVLVPLHRSRRMHGLTTDAMYRLRAAQGRLDEARAVLERAVAEPVAVDGAERAEATGSRTWQLLARANRLALLGRDGEAEAELERAQELAETTRDPLAFLTRRAEVLAALGDHEGAAMVLRQVPWGVRMYIDFCGLEWTVPLRSKPSFEYLLGLCPPLSSVPRTGGRIHARSAPGCLATGIAARSEAAAEKALADAGEPSPKWPE